MSGRRALCSNRHKSHPGAASHVDHRRQSSFPGRHFIYMEFSSRRRYLRWVAANLPKKAEKTSVLSSWKEFLIGTVGLLYKTKSIDGTKPNTNPKTNPNPIQLFSAFLEHRPTILKLASFVRFSRHSNAVLLPQSFPGFCYWHLHLQWTLQWQCHLGHSIIPWLIEKGGGKPPHRVGHWQCPAGWDGWGPPHVGTYYGAPEWLIRPGTHGIAHSQCSTPR